MVSRRRTIHVRCVDVPVTLAPFGLNSAVMQRICAVYCFGIGLVSIDGGCDLKTEVKFSEPTFLEEHEGQMR